MKRIIASRGTGKSTALLKMALKDNADIAVSCHTSMQHFIRIATEIGIDADEIKLQDDCVIIRSVIVAPIRYFITHAPSGIFAQHKKLYIDEIDACLRRLPSTHDIEGFTMSMEEAK